MHLAQRSFHCCLLTEGLSYFSQRSFPLISVLSPTFHITSACSIAIIPDRKRKDLPSDIIHSNLETSFRVSVEHNAAIICPAYQANETGRNVAMCGRQYLEMLARADDEIKLQRQTLLRQEGNREPSRDTVQAFFALDQEAQAQAQEQGA